MIVTLTFDSAYSRVGLFATSQKPVVLTCVNGNGAVVGVDSSLAPNLEDEGSLSVYLPNDHVEVTGSGIRACTITGPGNRFTVDDVTLGRAAPAHVTVSLSRSTVLPVFADSFNAILQRIRSPLNPANAHRLDTVSISVRGLLSSDSIWVISRPVDGSGGHVHPNLTNQRPRGTWYQVTAIADGAIDAAAPNRPDSLVIAAGQDSVLRVVYRSSGIAGSEWIVVRSATSRQFADSSSLTIGLAGLVRVPRSGTNYWMEASTNHSGHDEFLQSGAIALLDSIWGKWLKLHEANPTLYPMSAYPGQGLKFDLSATALDGGGLLDITGSWTDRPGHIAHREGLDADFNSFADAVEVPEGSVATDSTFRLMEKLCAGFTWVQPPADTLAVSCDAHGGTGRHFHVFLVPLRGRDVLLSWRSR